MGKKNKPASNGDKEAAPVAIRQMAFEDLKPVFELGTRLFTAEKWPTLYRAWDEYEVVELFGSDDEFCLVAECNDRVAGFALGTIMSKPRSAWRYGWLLWLGVSNRHKGRGIGSRLLGRLTELFIENGARMMLVDTDADNEPALAFFRGAGFANELQHIYLSKNLISHPKYLRRKAELEQSSPPPRFQKPRSLRASPTLPRPSLPLRARSPK